MTTCSTEIPALPLFEGGSPQKRAFSSSSPPAFLAWPDHSATIDSMLPITAVPCAIRQVDLTGGVHLISAPAGRTLLDLQHQFGVPDG